MKKRLRNIVLSLVLVVFLTSGTMVFSACGSKTYALGDLYKNYIEIVSGYDNITVAESGEISFDYSVYKNSDDESYLSPAIANNTQYGYLNSFYNVLFENSMEFINYALPLCSKASVEVDEVVYDELQEDLDSFSYALDLVSKRIDYLAEIVNAHSTNVTNSLCLNQLNNLFTTYDDLFQAIFSLNSTISNIYYNYALNNGNPDISAVDYDDFDEAYIQVIISYLSGRINYHISNYSLVYVELNLVGTDHADKITEDNTSPLTDDFYAYVSSISAVSVEIPEDVATILANDSKRQAFYNLAIEMYNYQLTMSNNYQLYRTASVTIKYNIIKNDPNASSDELLCVYIIDNYASLVEQYHAVLADVMALIQA